MIHVISIPKKDYSKRKVSKLEIALHQLNEANEVCLAIDSSSENYEIFAAFATPTRAQQMKYFAIGFLQAYELE